MSILVCIRQMPYSEQTVEFAGIIARAKAQPLTLMTVIDDESQREQAEAGLEEARELLEGISLSTKIRTGSVVNEILMETSEDPYETVVVGAHLAEGVLNVLFGSVTGKVAGRAPSSVLVVKGDREPKIKKILIPIGGVEMKRKVVKVGGQLAKQTNAEVGVLYVRMPVPSMYTGLDEIEETLPELLQTDTPIARHMRWSAQYLADLGVDAEVMIVQGIAADEIMRVARQGDYDLIVIGEATATKTLTRFFTDKVTPQVVDRANCCVFVVR